MHVRWPDAIDERSLAVNPNNLPSIERETQPEGRKEHSTQSDLYQALFPIYHLEKFCGLLPVTFIKLAVGRYQPRLRVLDILYSILVLAILLGAEVWGLWRDLKDGWEHSTRLKSRTAVIATCSDVLGVMTLTCVCIIGSFCRWKYLQVVVDRLIEVDEKIGMASPRKTRRFTIILTVCSLAYLWLTSSLDFYAWHRVTKRSKKMDDKGPINYMPMYFMYMVIVSLEIQYCVLAYNVGQRFFRLNKNLENMLKSGAITDYFRKDLGLAGDLQTQALTTAQGQNRLSHRTLRKLNESKPCTDDIAELITVHASLCDTISYINSAFGVAVLAITVTCLLHLIITPYFLILQADGNNEWIFLVVQGMWCVFHVIRMLVIVQPTYATVTEGKRTAVLVSQLLSSSFGIRKRKELEIFSLQLLHRPLEFSACGLFSLDRTLVTSIAGAVTTYLVILIQFQNADDTKGEVDIIKNATQLLKNASSLQNFTALKLPA